MFLCQAGDNNSEINIVPTRFTIKLMMSLLKLNYKSTLLSLALFVSVASYSQSVLPNIPIAASNGRAVLFTSIIDTNRVTVISFWATWCVPCINELDALQEKVDEGKMKSFQLIAISTDESRTVQKVRPLVKSKGWTFDIYLDESNEIKRAFNAINIPYVIVISKGKIVYQKTGYTPGDEEVLIEKVNQLNVSENP